eukprot:30420-Chlamydomonas_euryale.AAC.1
MRVARAALHPRLGGAAAVNGRDGWAAYPAIWESSLQKAAAEANAQGLAGPPAWPERARGVVAAAALMCEGRTAARPRMGA